VLEKNHLESPAIRLGISKSKNPWPLGLTYWIEVYMKEFETNLEI
jgi:hypothetical protein